MEEQEEEARVDEMERLVEQIAVQTLGLFGRFRRRDNSHISVFRRRFKSHFGVSPKHVVYIWD